VDPRKMKNWPKTTWKQFLEKLQKFPKQCTKLPDLSTKLQTAHPPSI